MGSLLRKTLPSLVGLTTCAACAPPESTTLYNPTGQGAASSSQSSGGATVGTGGSIAPGATGGFQSAMGGSAATNSGATGAVAMGATGAGAASATGGATGVVSGTGGVTGVTGGTSSIATGGASVVATGGSTAVATGGATATGTGGSEPVDAGAFSVAASGYVTTGMWRGYAWTAVSATGDATIEPEDFSGLAAGSDLCVTGEVPANDSYPVAILGINLNQESGATALGAATPTGTGVTIAITNAGATGLRLQVKTTAGDEYCTDIAATGGTVSWSDFTVDCWEAGGTAYDKEPIEAIMVMIPSLGPDGTDISYDVCVTNLVEN